MSSAFAGIGRDWRRTSCRALIQSERVSHDLIVMRRSRLCAIRMWLDIVLAAMHW